MIRYHLELEGDGLAIAWLRPRTVRLAIRPSGRAAFILRRRVPQGAVRSPLLPGLLPCQGPF